MRTQSNKWDKNISLSFIYSGKLSNIAFLYVAKLCNYLLCTEFWVLWLIGLAVNLKVQLGSICARCFQSVHWLSNVNTWPVLFKEQGSIKVWSCLWKWIMSRTKEIIEDLGKKELLLLIRLEKVIKTSLKSSDSTNPLSPSPEVVNQQRSLQSRTCNSLWGCESSQGNFQATKGLSHIG